MARLFWRTELRSLLKSRGLWQPHFSGSFARNREVKFYQKQGLPDSLGLASLCPAGMRQALGDRGCVLRKGSYLEEENNVPHQPENQRGVAVCYFGCVDANQLYLGRSNL